METAILILEETIKLYKETLDSLISRNQNEYAPAYQFRETQIRNLRFEIGQIKKAISLLKSKNKWISTKDRLPKQGERVLIIRDSRKWDSKRKPYVDIANVGFFEKETTIGGPISLTGYHKCKGIYFSVPAILHPDSVTFWQPIPNIDEE